MLFAFGRSEGICFYSSGKRRYWKGVPNSLEKHLKKDNSIKALSFGVEGTWFLKDGERCYLSSAAAVYYPHVQQIYESNEVINWVAFGPHGHSVAETNKKLYNSNNAKGIVRDYKTGGRVRLRCVSFGHNGAWVCVEDDGVIRSSGLSANIQAALNKKDVHSVELDANSSTNFFIQYVDGAMEWHLPLSWCLEFSLNPTLQLISAGPLFNDVSYQFSTSWRNTQFARPQVRYIYRITALKTESHKAYAARIGNKQKLWHATLRRCKLGDDGRGLQLCTDAKCSLCKIISTGFQKRFSLSSGMFGQGLYATTASSKAAGYSRNSQASKYKAVLLNSVVVGKAYETDDAMNGATAPPPGYNSVCGLPGNGLKYDETCVYDDNAILPTYLVLYDA